MKTPRTNILRAMLMATSYLVACDALLGPALAGEPTGPSVVVGHATVTSPNANQTVIDQTSSKALIDWTSFSIPTGSIVTFDQPNRSSLTVNRVTGPDSSVIDGELLATGSIWLINANGVLFGQGSQVDVGALLATTSDMSDSDFRKGHYDFSKPSSNASASVDNQGTIRTTNGGSIVLSAPEVSNEGLIEANLGTITLGGASAFSVDLVGDNLLRYQITTPVMNAPGGGTPAAALVSNSGTLSAPGGKVMMTASAAKSVQDDVINNTGIVEATSVSSHDGEVDFDAGPNGTVDIAGTVDVSGKGTGQTGGTIAATGAAVNIANGAVLDASGDRGGGTVLIGGGFHGKGKIANATATTVGNATIDVDALTKGNGGKVAIWSDQNTIFNGSISATGGALGGNGGYIETSGRNTLQVGLDATVDTSAANGTKGSWLLDPLNIVIETGGNTQLNNGTLGLNTDPGQTDTIAPSTITNALQTTDVLLEAANDITVLNDILYSSANSLTMLAEHDINVYANVQNAMASGGGGIYLIAGWNGVTTNPAQLTNPGVYGNNGGSIYVGTTAATESLAVGAASGTTTIAGANVTVESDNGTAQIGFAGAGGGDIDVFATGNVTVDALNSDYAFIGNGGVNVVGAITGNIDITAGGTATVEAQYNDFTNFNLDLAAIGNVATDGNSSETGNITINATAGVDVSSTGLISLAQIGNSTYDNFSGGNSTGGATGTITIDTGVLTIDADNTQGGWSEAIIGQGGVFTNVGTTGGTIDVNASSVDIVAESSNSSATQARITNRGDTSVIGDIDIASTGAITISADDQDQTTGPLAGIGNGEDGTGTTSGNITVQSGGALSILATGEGEARIGAGSAADTTIDVTATGNILLSDNNNDSVALGYGPGAWIGNFANGADPSGGNITVTSTGGSIELQASNPNADTDGAFAWIGNSSGSTTTGGNVTVSAPDATNGNIILDVADSNSTIYIGNNDLGGTSVVSGDTTVTAGNTLQGSGSDGTQVMIGNQGSAGISGNVDISALTFTNAGVNAWFINDIPNGNFTVDLTDTNPESVSFGGGWDYNSPYTFSLSTGGDLTLEGSVQNAGTGAIDITSGGNVLVGGTNATGDVSIGSAGGLTTVSGNNVTVESDNGAAQIGYAGAGGGDINVVATGDVIVDALNSPYALIGNGGANVGGAITGNIDIVSGGTATVEAPYSDYDDYNDRGLAAIGNVGGANSSESGNISITAPGGTSVLAPGISDLAYIGNLAFQDTSGGATGNITINTGALTVEADSSEGADESEAIIGDGGEFTTSGTTGGTIDIIASSVLLESDVSNGSLTEARITNRGAGAVTGDIDITTTGNLTMDANDEDMTSSGLASIGNSEDGTGVTTGAITIQSGGAISLLASGDAQSRIGAYGDQNNIDITAAGNILMSYANDYPEGSGGLSVFIGNFGNTTAPAGGNINVTSTGGSIELDASDPNGAGATVYIGNTTGSTTTSGNVTVTALDATNGNITLNAADSTANVYIGNNDVGGTSVVSGDVTVIAGNTLEGPDNGPVMIGNQGSAGISGNVDITAEAITRLSIEPWILNDIPNGNFTISQQSTNPVTLGNAIIYSSPYTLTASTGGDATFESSWQNSGTGAIDITAGGDVLIGGPNARGDVSIGSAGGLTTVSGENVTVESGNGSAQIGYAGNGGGNIDVVAIGDVTVDPTQGNGYAQIGNGSFNSSGNGGNIVVTADGDVSVYGGMYDGQIGNGDTTAAGAIGGNITVDAGGAVNVLQTDFGIPYPHFSAGIGNVGDGASSVSGNIAIAAPTGTYLNSLDGKAYIGNVGGSATGNITISTGDLSLYDSCITHAYCQTIVGDSGSNDGGTSDGAISINAGSVELVANQINGGDGLAVIGNVGEENVAGDIGINTTGAITISADGKYDLAGIGNGLDQSASGTVSGNITVQSGGAIDVTADGENAEAVIGNSNWVGPTTTGDINIQSGSSIDLTAAGDGQGDSALIGNGQALTLATGNIDVSAVGNIQLSAADGDASVIGSDGSDDGSNAVNNITVQSGGSVSILATGFGIASIGARLAPDTDIDVTAVGNILISDTNADTTGNCCYMLGASIGNLSENYEPSGGNITVTSTDGSIELQASDPYGEGAAAFIGNTNGGTTTSGNVTVTAPNAANGNIILNSADSTSTVYIGNDDVGGTGAVSGDITVTAGNTLEGPGNGSVMIGNEGAAGNISGNVDIAAHTITQLDVTPWIFNDVPNGNFTISQQNTNPVTLDSAIIYSSPYTLTASTGGDFTIEASVQNSGSGAIDITAGGNVLVGGPNASGNVAVGSAGGLTTINADNITLDAASGSAQIGYYGAGSGNIDVNATGNVTLTGGAGALDFAQIGNGGAETSEDSTGYTNSGIITVNGDNVVLDAGAGGASYAQIGNGGYQVGAGLISGTATNSGDITVTATHDVTLDGNGADAYAQIGNGGDQVDTNAASDAFGAIAGNITVAAGSGVTLTAGSGDNSYVQIGNGGYSANAPSGANPSNFTFSGNITVSDLSLTGSDTGTDGYAQVGNGDAGLAGIGNVSGNIDIRSGTITMTNGAAANADALIGGATGDGTVTGEITGYTPPNGQGENNAQEIGAEEEASQSQSQTQNTPQQPNPPNGDNPGGDGQQTQEPQGPQGTQANTPIVLPPPPPFQVLADDGANGDFDYEGEQETDGLVVTLGQSLEPTYGTNKNPSSRKQTLIPGLLRQIVVNDLENPHGIPPADEDYSNWGNEAIWR